MFDVASDVMLCGGESSLQFGSFAVRACGRGKLRRRAAGAGGAGCKAAPPTSDTSFFAAEMPHKLTTIEEEGGYGGTIQAMGLQDPQLLLKDTPACASTKNTDMAAFTVE